MFSYLHLHNSVNKQVLNAFSLWALMPFSRKNIAPHKALGYHDLLFGQKQRITVPTPWNAQMTKPPPDGSKQIHNVKNFTNTPTFFLSKITSCRLADQGPRTCSQCPAGPWLTCHRQLVWHPFRRLECPQSVWQVGWSCPGPWGRSPLTHALPPEATKGEGVCFFNCIFLLWLTGRYNQLSIFLCQCIAES